MIPDTKDIAIVADAVKNVSKPIAEVAKATSKSSISRLTKDQIFQFPLIIDADIDDDEKLPIIKSIEKNYSALIMSAIVNTGVIDRDKYDDINKFLRKFHNNNDMPFNALDTGLSVTDAVASEGYVSEQDLLAMWDCIEEQLDSESINNIYLPFKRTATKLTYAIEAARASIAMEEDLYFKIPEYDVIENKAGKQIRKIDNMEIIKSTSSGDPKYVYVKANSNAGNYDKNVQKYGSPKTMAEWEMDNRDKKYHDQERIEDKKFDNQLKTIDKNYNNQLKMEDKRFNNQKKLSKKNFKNQVQLKEMDYKRDDKKNLSLTLGKTHGEVIRDEKYNYLSPTMIRLTIANIKKGAGAPWSQELIIGVRAMPRLLSQSVMISNMVEMFKDRIVFKFIKWTRGEIKWSDILFGWGRAVEDATAKGSSKWIKILRNRAKKSKMFRLGGQKLNPNCTIIITAADAHMIQEQCGVNPTEVSNVRKMMDKYFLLGFGIYDTEAKMLDIIYDGETEFSTYSLRQLSAEAKKETNLIDFKKY